MEYKDNRKFSVFVGGTEVNDYLLNYSDALDLLLEYLEADYDDVHIVEIK